MQLLRWIRDILIHGGMRHCQDHSFGEGCCITWVTRAGNHRRDSCASQNCEWGKDSSRLARINRRGVDFMNPLLTAHWIITLSRNAQNLGRLVWVYRGLRYHSELHRLPEGACWIRPLPGDLGPTNIIGLGAVSQASRLRRGRLGNLSIRIREVDWSGWDYISINW